MVALTRNADLLKLISTTRGRLDLECQPWPMPLPELAGHHSARWAARLEVGALEDMMDRWAERLEREQDLLEQAIEWVAVFRDMQSEGTVEVWPRAIGRIPVVSAKMVHRTLDVICPDGRTLLFAAFEEGRIVTSIAAHRQGNTFDRIVGPERLRRDMGLVSHDWTRDYRHLARAVDLTVGPLSVGAFAEVATWERLAHEPSPGAWAAAVAARDVILHPIAPAIAIPLGLDVGRAVFSTVRELAQRLGASEGWSGDPIRLFQGMIDEANRRFGGRGDGDF